MSYLPITLEKIQSSKKNLDIALGEMYNAGIDFDRAVTEPAPETKPEKAEA